MAARQAACDPCRTSKLACDHQRPVCSRCQARSRPDDCTYRATPFKRKRQSPTPQPPRPPRPVLTSRLSIASHHGSSASPTPRLPSSAPQGPSPYPNPGYQGFSSHATFFNRIPTDGLHQSPDASATRSRALSTPGLGPASRQRRAPSSDMIQRGADTISQMLTIYNLDTLKLLVTFWLEKGINLFLAEVIVPNCIEALKQPQPGPDGPSTQHQHLSELLFANSARPLDPTQATDADSFSRQFTGYNTRWETWAIFWTAVGRATFDVPFFPPLYKDSVGQLALRKFATLISDACLEYCLTLDCLNDLQLVLQAENFILHSNVDGDQSYDAWRRLGDSIASLYALGYHQKIETRLPEVPFFLAEFRRTAFAYIYSADKNVAIFLGRPPRISRRFCYFQSPLLSESHEKASRASELTDGGSARGPPGIDETDIETSRTWYNWNSNTPIQYRSDARWSATCAALKEEILELLSDRKTPDCIPRARAAHARAEALWAALPPHFKLQGNSLKDHMTTSTAPSTPSQGMTPAVNLVAEAELNAVARPMTAFERDFLASVRLNYLHVQFLLRLVFMNSFAEPDAQMIEISEGILELVVDIILVKDRLVNSGTTLSWKVTYYGLPAVGVLLLAILRRHKSNRTSTSPPPPINQTRILRHLIVLVAELETGTLAKPDEPNYGLVSTATETIQGFLNSVQLMGHGNVNGPVHAFDAGGGLLGAQRAYQHHGPHHSSDISAQQQGAPPPPSSAPASRQTRSRRYEDPSTPGRMQDTLLDDRAGQGPRYDAPSLASGSLLNPNQLGGDGIAIPTTEPPSSGADYSQPQQTLPQDFDLDTWDYEVGFWQSLADWSSVALDGTVGNGVSHSTATNPF